MLTPPKLAITLIEQFIPMVLSLRLFDTKLQEPILKSVMAPKFRTGRVVLPPRSITFLAESRWATVVRVPKLGLLSHPHFPN